MLIVMEQGTTDKQIQAVVKTVEKRGYEARPIPGGDRVSIGVLHNKGSVDAGHFLGLDGVKEVIPVTKPYKLVSREFKKESHLPIIVDPSHASGVRDQVGPLACACAALGADGVMIEVHNKPDEALSDGAQSLYPDQFADLMARMNAIHGIVKENE